MAGINLSSSTSEKKGKGGGIFDSSFTIVTIIFILTIVGFAGSRFYIKTLDTKRAGLAATLEESSSRLQGKNVDRAAYFDNRLTLVKEQLSARTIDSQKLLNQLETLVVPSIRLTKYEYNETEKFVVVEGDAESLKYVAQQIISFKSDDLFAGIQVHSLTRTKEGRITFSLIADFN